MNLRKPCKRDLRVGNVVDVLNGDGKLLGQAKLIKRVISRYKQDHLPYVRHANKKEGDEELLTDEELNAKEVKDQAPLLWIWASERWQVEWVKHSYHRPGDMTCNDIHYFVELTSDMPSYVEYHTLGNKGVPPEGTYIFLEEDGVLTTDGETYIAEALKGLDRVKKSMGGDIVIFTSRPLEVKERWELHKIKHRIFDFIYPDSYDNFRAKTFSQAIVEYLDNLGEDVEDYIILSGVSKVKGDRVIQADITTGLKLKPSNRKNNLPPKSHEETE